MSLYGDYILEREGQSILENDDGFATYQFFGNVCYIINIYVVPEKRKTKVASQLADKICEIARLHDCTQLMGSVSLCTSNPTASIKVLLAYGFYVTEFKNDLLWFKKDL